MIIIKNENYVPAIKTKTRYADYMNQTMRDELHKIQPLTYKFNLTPVVRPLDIPDSELELWYYRGPGGSINFK